MARGIAETWRLCKKVEDIFDTALKQNAYLTKELLWEANVKHFRDEGAEHAYLYMISSAIYSLAEKELYYLLEKLRPVIDPPEASNDSDDVKLSLGTMFKIVLKVLWGLLTRKVSFRGLTRVLSTNRSANKIKKHYKRYPEDPERFEEWVKKANEIWAKRKNATRTFQSTTAIYP